MKRKIAGLLTALMVLSMGMTAFAAPVYESSTTDNTKTQVTEAGDLAGVVATTAKSVKVTVNGQEVEVGTPEISQVPQGFVESAIAQAKAVAGTNAILMGLVEVSIPDLPEGASVTLTLTVEGVPSNVKVIHYITSEGKWEDAANVSVSGNDVTFTVNGLSPIGFVVPASPKTGETTPVWPIVMIVCAAGIVFCGTKVKFNR